MRQVAAAGDYDDDGDIDLFIVLGDSGPNLLYRNTGNLVFEDVAAEAGVAATKSIFGSYRHSSPAFADLDGDTDILQLHMHAENAATLWMNQTTNNWLSVRLRGAAPNTQAVGARIVATVAGEDHLREVTLGSNFASHNPTDQIFGLGSMAQVDTLTVEWPDGERTVMQALAANQELVIDHPGR